MSCGSTKTIDHKTHKEAILSVLNAQEMAWNEGSIEKFMEGYWMSEDLTFVGRSGVTKGWESTLSNYKRGYPDRAAMGMLNFTVMEMRPIGRESYLMLGQYELVRKEDNPSGFFSLIWQKINGKWVITSDHTSG